MNLTSLPGVILDGKYRIEGLLGQGGMGAVFVATHLGTTRTVAVKVIVPQLAAQDEFLLRFSREAEAAGRLRHPNVVNVTDFGFTSVEGEAHLAYLVMEFLGGETLSAFLKSAPHPPFDLILDILDQVALGLDAAHHAGIVHRDLKPDNIWLESNRRGGYNVKVLDFGIAKISNPVSEPLPRPEVPSVPLAETTTAASPEIETLVMAATNVDKTEAITIASAGSISQAGSIRFNASTLQTTVGSILGTPSFMAPEQCQGGAVDHRADIYSLATIAYQLFCGRLPFEARNLRELLDKQINTAPPPPREVERSISPGVSQTILRGLAKDPATRQRSAGTFAAQLRASAEGETTFLASGKFYANNYLNCFLPLIVACFAVQIPIFVILLFVGKAIAARLPSFAPAIVLVVHLCSIVIVAFLSQVYKAASTMVFEDAASVGYFRPELGTIAKRIWLGLADLLSMHLMTLPRLSWKAFREASLWPSVWAAEGLTGRATLERAVELTATQPASTLALAARQYGVVLLACLAAPSLFVSLTGSFTEYATLLFNQPRFSAFALLYPMMLCAIFLGFGPAFEFLYRSARRCLGEEFEWALPTGMRQKRAGRSRLIRPGTIVWMLPGTLMLFSMAYRLYPKGKAVEDLTDAASDGRRMAMSRSLDAGASVDSTDSRGRTALMFAAMNGDVETISQLLSRRARIDAQTSTGATALIMTILYRHPDVAAFLLDRKADPNIRENDNQTALMHAAMRGDVETCRLLLAHGAKRELKDDHGKRAADYARDEGYQELVRILD